jgi:DNA-binding NarL/FixJ family response regulator
VLDLMVEGFLNKEISALLEIGIRTAEMHVGRVVSKLGARSRTEAIIKAARMRPEGEGQRGVDSALGPQPPV